MFKTFKHKENVSGQNIIKTSAQRAIKATILEQFPELVNYADEIFPKKDPLVMYKCSDHISLITVNQKVLFFQKFDEMFIPSLHLLHQCRTSLERFNLIDPNIVPHFQVDKGAIKFVISGANVMCKSCPVIFDIVGPGLTSKGGILPEEDLPSGSLVAITAEGKKHAMALGISKMSIQEIKSVNKGIAVESVHYLLDGLYMTDLAEL